MTPRSAQARRVMGNPDTTLAISLCDTAADHDAVALIAPLGIEADFSSSVAFSSPPGWHVDIVREVRTGLLAAIMVPPEPRARPEIRHRFSHGGPRLSDACFRPEECALTMAADELAADIRRIGCADRDGHAGLVAIVEETNRRFDYGEVPYEQRWYAGAPHVPQVACVAGNCIDINTYLVAALRSAGYEAAYITCYFVPHAEGPAAAGMHCWVRTRFGAIVEDWDIAHFKKLGTQTVTPKLNPIPGHRFPLSYGRSHVYPWRGLDIQVSTPSQPHWVLLSGDVVWPEPSPIVSIADH